MSRTLSEEIDRVAKLLEDSEYNTIDERIKIGKYLANLYKEYKRIHGNDSLLGYEKVGQFLNSVSRRNARKNLSNKKLANLIGELKLTNKNKNKNKSLKRYGNYGPYLGVAPRIGGTRKRNQKKRTIRKRRL